jgi:hypothetical protein
MTATAALPPRRRFAKLASDADQRQSVVEAKIAGLLQVLGRLGAKTRFGKATTGAD